MHSPLLKAGELVITHDLAFEAWGRAGIVAQDEKPEHDFISIREFDDNAESLWGKGLVYRAVWSFAGPIPTWRSR